MSNRDSPLPSGNPVVWNSTFFCQERESSTQIDDFSKIANINFTLAQFLIIFLAIMIRIYCSNWFLTSVVAIIWSMIWSIQNFQKYSFPQNQGQSSEYDRLAQYSQTQDRWPHRASSSCQWASRILSASQDTLPMVIYWSLQQTQRYLHPQNSKS